MANHCYNWASLEGSKEMLDLLERRLTEATKDTNHLWWETFIQVLDMPIEEEDTYDCFGSRWFRAYWERQDDTTLMLSGDSAWSPVSEFFRKLSEVYQLKIKSVYEEGGCDFGGWFDCDNGAVLRDECTSYHVHRFLEEGEDFLSSLHEDIADGCYESIKDIDQDLIDLLSEAQVNEIIEALNITYPFDEGDIYYTIENGEIIESVWDDVSVDLYDRNEKYYSSLESAKEDSRWNGKICLI